MDCIVHGVTKSLTQLSDFHFQRRSYWIRWPLAPVTVLLIRRERFGDIQTHPKWRRPCDNKGRDWVPATSRNWTRKEPSKRACLYQHFDFRFLAFKNWGEIVSVLRKKSWICFIIFKKAPLLIHRGFCSRSQCVLGHLDPLIWFIEVGACLTRAELCFSPSNML